MHKKGALLSKAEIPKLHPGYLSMAQMNGDRQPQLTLVKGFGLRVLSFRPMRRVRPDPFRGLFGGQEPFTEGLLRNRAQER